MTDISADTMSIATWNYASTFTDENEYVDYATGAHVSLQNGLPLVLPPSALRLAPSQRRTGELAVKHGLDRLGAALLLLLLAPVLLTIGILVKLTSPGPVLFTQLREGQHGLPFRIVKFRTMHAAACDPSGVEQTTRDDDRVTRLGQFLRRTNLDELPQLINVLRGEMSFIGPRPHPLNMRAAGRRYDELVPCYAARLQMRPGISGWAQCNGFRGPTDDPLAATARIHHDIAYIQNFSLLLDLRAAWKTLVREMTGGTGF